MMVRAVCTPWSLALLQSGCENSHVTWKLVIPRLSSVHEHFSSILGCATYRNKSNIKKLNQMKFRKSYKKNMISNNLWLLWLQMSSDFKNLFHNYKEIADNIWSYWCKAILPNLEKKQYHPSNFGSEHLKFPF